MIEERDLHDFRLEDNSIWSVLDGSVGIRTKRVNIVSLRNVCVTFLISTVHLLPESFILFNEYNSSFPYFCLVRTCLLSVV